MEGWSGFSGRHYSLIQWCWTFLARRPHGKCFHRLDPAGGLKLVSKVRCGAAPSSHTEWGVGQPSPIPPVQEKGTWPSSNPPMWRKGYVLGPTLLGRGKGTGPSPVGRWGRSGCELALNQMPRRRAYYLVLQWKGCAAFGRKGPWPGLDLTVG